MPIDAFRLFLKWEMGFDERVAGHSTVGMKLTFRAVTVAWLDSAPEVFNTKSRLARLFTKFSFRGEAKVWPDLAPKAFSE